MSSSSSCISTSATTVAIYCPKIRRSRRRIRSGFMFSSSPPTPSTWHCWVKTMSSSYSTLSSSLSVSKLFLKFPSNPSLRPRPLPLCPVMEWQDCTVKMEVDVPASVAYKCYSDREAIAQWMPFISSVKILEDQPDLSRWSLKYKAFGRDIEFSWIARNMQPIPNQKIHWRSMEGLPNRGAVRFYPKGPSSCIIELTVSYEVPQILTPVASALLPFLEGLLLRGLERFAAFAKTYQ